MATDDDLEKSEPQVDLQGVNQEGGSDLDDAHVSSVTITARESGYSEWAYLEVEYSWDPLGRFFSMFTKSYRATDNGRSSGNIKLGLVSAVDTGWLERKKNGIQDGYKHTYEDSLSVTGNADFAVMHFNWIYDRNNVRDLNMTGQQRVEFVPATPVINPIRNVNSRAVNVSGAGGHGQVYVRTSYSPNPIAANMNGSSWNASVNLPANVRYMTIDAYQIVGGKQSPFSPSQHLYLAYLTAPVANAVLMKGDIFRGLGAPGSKVNVVKADNQSFELAPQATVALDDSWLSPLQVELSSGSVSVVAIYEASGFPRAVSEPVTYRVLGTPIITGPAANSLQPQTFVVSGNNGLSGATVNIYLDWSPTRVGYVTLSADGNWSVTVTVPAGPVSLAAEQTLSGKPSGRSPQRGFKIKPPKLVGIDVSYLSSGAVRFSGAGYDTATVDVHIANNMDPQGSEPVRSGAWFFEWTNQPPAQHEMNIRQRVPDGSGWIYSDWSDRLTVPIPVPVPTLSVQVGEDRKPEFFGTGDTWPGQPGRIEVRREGETEPAVPIADVNTADKTWSRTATEAWDPGTYLIQAWQLFNDLRSDPTEPPRTLIIRAPLPTVEIRDDGLTPHFSGTCLDGAQVNLGFDGEQGTPHAATMDGPNWTFTREEPFLPGAYTARVTQTIGGQTSNEATLAFDIVVLQPVITSPVDEDVDHNPVIRGTGGVPGATMYVFDAMTKLPLGERPVTENQWSVSLENLSFGPHTVYAVQQYGEWPSEESQRVTFTVILLPPTIDRPQPGDRMPRIAVIDGYARAASGFDVAWVELWLEGAEEPLTTVRANRLGYWSYDAHLPVGEYVLRARQRFVEEVSDFGPDHPITVVPPIPVIESPALQQHIGATATISGHGYAGDWVEVAWSDAPDTILGRTQVQANRTWSVALPIDRSAGEHHWIVQQECDDYRSGWSEAHPVLLLSGAPTFTAPEAGHWFAGTALFEGTGETGKRIELSHWFDSRQVVSQDDLVTGGTWTASPDAPLLAGPHWLKARQDDSDWADSLRFEVARVEDNRGR